MLFSSRRKKKIEKKKQHMRAYLRAVPQLLTYKLIAFVIMQVMLLVLKKVGMLLIYSTGRVAVTSGDFGFLFYTWQGWLIIFLTLLALMTGLTVDINGSFLLSARLLRKEPIHYWSVVKDSFGSLPLYFSPHGLILAVYVAVGSPILGMGLNLSLTKRYYIPTFVADAIATTPRYLAIYITVIIILLIFAILHTMAFPFILLEKEGARQAMRDSRTMMKKNWKRFFRRLFVFSLQLGLLVLAGSLIVAFFGELVISQKLFSRDLSRFLFLFVYGGSSILFFLLSLAFPAIETLEITRLFLNAEREEEIFFERDKTLLWALPLRIWTGCLASIFLIFAVIGTVFFEDIFPARSDTAIIAHRLGGFDAPENSLSGVDLAQSEHAYGYETDIQRSKDGVYVINHDTTFARTCGVDRAVSDMTWEEIKRLRIVDSQGNPSDQHPPSLEELLDYAKDKGKLYLELKGPTADQKMADDVSQMVREKGMTGQCVITSLKYNLVSYVYKQYPEIDTGYIYYFSFGDKMALDCDIMIMEEESATKSAIDTIHLAGKKAVVWTVNTEESAYKFIDSDADAVITDDVGMCNQVEESLAQRSDIERVLDYMSRDGYFGITLPGQRGMSLYVTP